MDIILAVDKDIEFYEQQKTEWLKYGIDMLRVDTMNEAIAMLTQGREYIFVGINEDSIPNYLSRMQIMRDATDLPIFVLTTNYSIGKKLMAMNQGVDVYDPFDAYIKTNVLIVLGMLKTHGRWTNRRVRNLPIHVAGGIILSPSRRKVLVGDNEVTLTKLEFDILRYFMNNHDIVLTYAQIYRKIWGGEYDDDARNLVWQYVHTLRQKIDRAAGNHRYITNERDVGYRFAAVDIK